MADLTADQETEVTFLSGITAQGTVAAKSFWTWNDNNPATYSSTRSYEAKWGSTHAGTAGSLTVAFNPDSNWSTAELAAFNAAMHLWSAETNITFNVISSVATADVVIARTTDKAAQGGIGNYDPGTIGTTVLGHALDGSVTIDTSVAGFGPIGSAFSVDGGYPWETIVHELGHVLGLGHAGAYDNALTPDSSPQLTAYDNTAYSLMSYNEAPDVDGSFAWGRSGGYLRSAVTPMMLDIAAADRIYGLPVGGPLSGGQIFGFNTNIAGDIAQFFDFTINTRPVVTLFDTGLNNTFDVSGYTTGSNIDLHQGTFSSVSGLTNNVAIAFGTRIDTGIGGSAGDHIVGNDDGDVLMGGTSGDTITGGAGNDHIYGNMRSTTQGTADGDDVIDTGGGLNYVNGNAGNDAIIASAGTNRLYGGQGNDTITVTGHGINHLNGNLGDDVLQIQGGGLNDMHGGQGNDTLSALAGTNQMFGEVGNDVLSGGNGFDVMTGGPGSDLFLLTSTSTNANIATWDEITDFTDGTDKFHMDGGLPLVLHSTGNFTSESDAAAYAQAAFGAATNEAAALQVGADTYLFYTVASSEDAVVKLDGINAALIDQSDFTTGTGHL